MRYWNSSWACPTKIFWQKSSTLHKWVANQGREKARQLADGQTSERTNGYRSSIDCFITKSHQITIAFLPIIQLKAGLYENRGQEGYISCFHATGCYAKCRIIPNIRLDLAELFDNEYQNGKHWISRFLRFSFDVRVFVCTYWKKPQSNRYIHTYRIFNSSEIIKSAKSVDQNLNMKAIWPSFSVSMSQVPTTILLLWT